MNRKLQSICVSINIASMVALGAFPLLSSAAQQKAEDALAAVAPYPAAKQGQKRYAIFLSEKAHEEDYQVEISLGKMAKVDCNRHFMGGELKKETLQGWGYTYFVLDRITAPASTRMACPDQAEQERFIPVASATRLERYNSKLPLVIYVPQEIQVRYRIWQAEKEYQPANMQ